MSRIAVELLGVALLAALVSGCRASGLPEGGRWVDLTHGFDDRTLVWPTSEPFVREELSFGWTEGGYFYASGRFEGAEHGGTHVDAPIHFAEGRSPVDAIPLERLIGPAAVVDVSGQVAADRDHRVTVDDLLAWEARHGRLPDGAIVLIRTGLGGAWPDARAYMGTATRGVQGVAELHFPGLGADAARWLVAERDVGAVGLDTPSIDHGPSTDFAAHVALFEAEVPAFENVAHLDALPATGAFVVALPMKIIGGSGAPLRIVAWVP